MFTHKRKGYLDHQHETIEQARNCERGLGTADTIVYRESGMLHQRTVQHADPCVCGPYDRCPEVRMSDAQQSGNWRDRFRSYCD